METLYKMTPVVKNGVVVGYNAFFRIEGTNVTRIKFVARPSMKGGK